MKHNYLGYINSLYFYISFYLIVLFAFYYVHYSLKNGLMYLNSRNLSIIYAFIYLLLILFGDKWFVWLLTCGIYLQSLQICLFEIGPLQLTSLFYCKLWRLVACHLHIFPSIFFTTLFISTLS